MVEPAQATPEDAGSDVDFVDLELSFFTGRARVDVLRGVTLHVEPGERVAIMGPSGAGKSSLLYCLAGLLVPQGGRVRVDATDLSALEETALAAYRRSTVGIVYQAFHLIAALDALSNIALPALLAGVDRQMANARAMQLLRRIGMDERASHKPAQLSGGEQQRVAIARAVANGPRLLLADEPTGNLDRQSADEVLSLLTDISGGGRTLVVATHDDRVAAAMDRVIHIEAGRLTV